MSMQCNIKYDYISPKFGISTFLLIVLKLYFFKFFRTV